MSKINFAVLVHACDRYELLFKGFEHFFNKFWDQGILSNRYFATEDKSVSIENFINKKSGAGEWSDRLKTVLLELDEEYIVFMQEDMWLNKPVSRELMNSIFDYVESNGINLLKLHSSEVYVTKGEGIYLNGLHLSMLDNRESDYLMSHQISIWKKSFLLKQLKEGESPWRNEKRGTRRLKKSNPEIYLIDVFSENGKKPVNINKDEILISGYNTVSVNARLNHNILPYIDELKCVEGFTEYAEKLELNYRKGFTHDGQPGSLKRNFLEMYKIRIRKLFTPPAPPLGALKFEIVILYFDRGYILNARSLIRSVYNNTFTFYNISYFYIYKV